MSSVHTVVQGEHLSGIANKYGFTSYKTIWDHAQNAELKKKRQNPNVIFPGDELFIPDKGQKEESRNNRKETSIRAEDGKAQASLGARRPIRETDRQCEM